MATKKEQQAVKEQARDEELAKEESGYYDELVSYTAPFPRDETDRPIIVSVNGETYRIARGATVEIPRKHYLALQNAAEQDRAAWESRRAAKQASEKPLMQL